MVKSKASILRDLRSLEFDGLSLVNLHISGCYYVPTERHPLTHPKQLAIRRDSTVDERWACWSCQIPVDPAKPHMTGKVTFPIGKAQCCPLGPPPDHTLLAFCLNALDRCMELAKKDIATLPCQDQVNLVLGYCRVVCQASMPMWTGSVPSPELTVLQGMSRSQMAALLM